MSYYFSIQFIRWQRWFEEIGINYLVGLILIAVLGLIGSELLFFKTSLAKWLFSIFALSLVIGRGDRNRTSQLKIIFDRSSYLKIRILENGLVCLPFSVYLIYQGENLVSVGLLSLSILLAIFTFNTSLSRVIPTPFKKLPFENIVGFRKSILFIIFIYFISFKAVQVSNYNLGIACLGLLFLTFMSFYLKPEDKYFVWIYKSGSAKFIKDKVIESFKCATLITVPLLSVLLIIFQENAIYSLAVYLLGYLFLYSIIVAKYSAYPSEMNVPQGILYVLSLWFPPMLLIVIPIFYKKSKGNLEQILE